MTDIAFLVAAVLTLGLQEASQDSVDQPIREVRRHRVGVAFEIGAVADGLRVARVESGEPGEQAGLQVGDVLLEVEGVDAATITQETLVDQFSRSGSLSVRYRRGSEVLVTTLEPRRASLADREVVGTPLEPAHQVPVFGAYLDGQPMHFLLHTGTLQSSLTPSAFERLGRPVPPEGVAVDLGPLRIGHLEFTGRRFAGGPPAIPGIEYDGVVALPDLAPFLVQIEYADDYLLLESGALPPADGSGVLDYFVCEDTGPAVTIDIAGHDFDVHLDSSYRTGIAVGEEYISVLPTKGEPAVMGEVRTPDETHAILGAELDGYVRIGRHQIERPGIRFSSAFEHSNLGPDALEEFTVTFDTANRRVRFQRRTTFLATLLQEAAATPSLDEGRDALRAAFQADRGKRRLLMLLSPT